MQDLSKRQKDLLKLIIEEYIGSASPVGSKALVDKYHLKYSPATIRNEMADLVRKGFLEMQHSSSGRIPSALGLRFYITDLMEEVEVPVLQEVAMKQRIWEERFKLERFLRNAALALADATKYLAVVMVSDGYLTHAGSFNILEYPEFFDIDVAKAALNLVDSFDLVNRLVSKGLGENDVKVLIGPEMDLDNLYPCSFVFTNFSCKENTGTLGIVGPCRMPYYKIIPALRYMRSIVNEVSSNF